MKFSIFMSAVFALNFNVANAQQVLSVRSIGAQSPATQRIAPPRSTRRIDYNGAPQAIQMAFASWPILKKTEYLSNNGQYLIGNVTRQGPNPVQFVYAHSGMFIKLGTAFQGGTMREIQVPFDSSSSSPSSTRFFHVTNDGIILGSARRFIWDSQRSLFKLTPREVTGTTDQVEYFPTAINVNGTVYNYDSEMLRHVASNENYYLVHYVTGDIARPDIYIRFNAQNLSQYTIMNIGLSGTGATASRVEMDLAGNTYAAVSRYYTDPSSGQQVAYSVIKKSSGSGNPIELSILNNTSEFLALVGSTYKMNLVGNKLQFVAQIGAAHSTAYFIPAEYDIQSGQVQLFDQLRNLTGVATKQIYNANRGNNLGVNLINTRTANFQQGLAWSIGENEYLPLSEAGQSISTIDAPRVSNCVSLANSVSAQNFSAVCRLSEFPYFGLYYIPLKIN